MARKIPEHSTGAIVPDELIPEPRRSIRKVVKRTIDHDPIITDAVLRQEHEPRPVTEEEVIDDITNKDDPLNHIMIPLIPLRMFIADLGRDGFKKVPIGFLLNEMHRLYKEDQGGQND